ncbi:hypothetical protein NE237_006510 [Protea cynaroides]|uniref:Uncharacterized protein n=1 Tax=Protea cynaroides TaxID=273540 RepID=A0A9Q0KN83_9MAGN|nr:hypothetical protein NE237_006510 [Protea cynaroides]
MVSCLEGTIRQEVPIIVEDLQRVNVQNVRGSANLALPVVSDWADVSYAEQSSCDEGEEQDLKEGDLHRSPVVVDSAEAVVGEGFVSEPSGQGHSMMLVGIGAGQPNHVDLEAVAATVAGNRNQDGGTYVVKKSQCRMVFASSVAPAGRSLLMATLPKMGFLTSRRQGAGAGCTCMPAPGHHLRTDYSQDLAWSQGAGACST